MTDTHSLQMGRKNAKRNKSTASVGKKHRTSSTNSVAKFQPGIEGFSTFLNVVSKLGKHGQEFTWHDLRKVYHKETQRQLTAEELNGIFCSKNLTKKQVLELPKVRRFMECVDGTMLCRFRLLAEPLDWEDDEDELPPLMTTSMESDVLTQSSASPEQSVSPLVHDEKQIAISTECDAKAGPTSDLSKSETSPSQRSLSQQASVQSSMTDDEGWASGRELQTRSDNSSPVAADEGKDEVDGKRKSADLEDEVFEADQRIAAGSDVINDVMIVEEAKSEDVFKRSELSSPILVTDSIAAAFDLVHSIAEHTSKTIPEAVNASEEAKVHATPRKVTPVAAERSKPSEELASGPPIKKLIEKFDTGVNFVEHKSPTKSIYKQVLEEIGENFKQTDKTFVAKEQNAEADVTNVIFRSTSTHSTILANGKEQLAEFVAEQEAKKESETTTDETEVAFGVKEQSSLSSLDREYFDSKMVKNEDLFAELGVHNADGFQLMSGKAQKSGSNESGTQSTELITVIENNPVEPPKAGNDEVRNRTDSIDSDADVPYSLCSEDEAEPMTMIEKSMKGSQSAEQLSPPKEEQKPKTVVVNVELDANAKNRDNSTVKERIAALQAVVNKKQVPVANVDSIDEKDEVLALARNEELEHCPLDVQPPSTSSDGTVRRRQVRFMRGCCTVQ